MNTWGQLWILSQSIMNWRRVVNTDTGEITYYSVATPQTIRDIQIDGLLQMFFNNVNNMLDIIGLKPESLSKEVRDDN